MTKTDIIDRVKTLLDENTPSGSGFLVGTIEDKPIESHIKSLLNPTWIEFGMVSPVHLLPCLTVEVIVAADGVVAIPMPAGYLRTVNVFLPSWVREVMPVTADNPVYDHQKNTYSRGTKTRPVATLNGDGIKAYVGVKDEAAKWMYVPILDFAVEGTTVSARLSEAFCCNVAANVYLVMKDQPTAAALMAKRDTMLQ